MSPFFATFFLVISAALLTSILIKNSSLKYRKKQEDFWERERRANTTRKQPLDDLSFIHIPMETLCPDTIHDDVYTSFQDTLERLSHADILNFSGLSNTDLKLKYGVANFPMLTTCEERYIELVRTLYLYGKTLAENGQDANAITVLEYGISIGTDISGHYTLLASLYQKTGQEEKINDLISAAQNLHSLMKDSILRSLKCL